MQADNQQDADRAENLLLSASIEHIGKSENTEVPKFVKEAVSTFLEEIEQLDVKVELIVRDPLTFTFVCSSLGSLKDLIEYFEDPLLQTGLDAVATALQRETGLLVKLSANISSNLLQAILGKLGRLTQF